MKKSYTWQILLLILATYFILLGFFPNLYIVFDYIRLSLLIATPFLWVGILRRNAILSFIGWAFLTVYLQEVTPFFFFINGGALFVGLILFGVALHGIQKKRRFTNPTPLEDMATAAAFNDANYLTIQSIFKDLHQVSTATALKNISIKTFCSSVYLNLSQAQFADQAIYLNLSNTVGSIHLFLPKEVAVISTVHSALGEMRLPPQPSNPSKTLYLTGNNTASTLTISYL